MTQKEISPNFNHICIYCLRSVNIYCARFVYTYNSILTYQNFITLIIINLTLYITRNCTNITISTAQNKIKLYIFVVVGKCKTKKKRCLIKYIIFDKYLCKSLKYLCRFCVLNVIY